MNILSFTNTKESQNDLFSEEDKEYIDKVLFSEKKNTNTKNDNVIVNGNNTYKHGVDLKSTKSKLEVISKLKKCNYKSPPIEISNLLEELFSSHNTKKGHWLYIAQNYSPRTINRIIDRIIKVHKRGEETIKNPAAFFTFLIKFRKKKKGKRKNLQESMILIKT